MSSAYSDQPFASSNEKEAPSYSPEEKIWRPVFEKEDGDKPQRLTSDTMRAVKLGPLGLSKSDIVLLRDNFNLSTWLLIGACMQGVVVSFWSTSYAILPAGLLLSWRILVVLLQCAGIFTNPNMKDVILGKWSVHSPDADGKLVGEPAQQGSKIVYLLGARCNHPLGMFAPGFKNIADQFRDMIIALEKEPDKYGFHTSTTYIGAGGDRSAGQEILSVMYFNNLDGLHRFAHAPSHRIGREYWNQNVAKFDHIAITHEIYVTKESEAVEGIYVNYHRTGYSGQNVKMADGTYVNPLVDASEGQYRTSKGRLNLVDHGRSNDRYYEAPSLYARPMCPVMRR